MTTLDGATNEPAPGTLCASAGEFAAMWNTRDEAGRQEMLESIQRNAGAALRCFIESHDAIIARVLEPRPEAAPEDSDDAQRADLHARYHDMPGNLMWERDCGYERCEFWAVTSFILSPAAD